MKKIFYMLSIALLGVTACNTEKDMPEPMAGNGKVTYVMGINVPGMGVKTRGVMDTQPIIDNIYVAVFGDAGYLNDYTKAEPCNADGSAKTDFSGIENDVLFYYKVTLTASSSKKYVHIIANGPEKMDFGYDEQIMPNLTTDAGDGAYWTMFELPHGTSVKDEDGYDVVTDEAKAAFSNLKLIRNFAKVEVKLNSSVDNFELEGYKVFYTPAKGRIVTWKEDYQAGTTSDVHMDGYYTPYISGNAGGPMSFLDLQNEGYVPSLATGATIDMTAPAAGTYVDTPQFVFERERNAGENRPFVIVKGKFENNPSSYYRLDFTDKDGHYMPLLRNFLYSITIDAVVKNGVANPADAQPSNANVSMLVQDMTDLADGKSRIYVQYLDKTFVYSEATPIKFKYVYLPDATQTASATTIQHATFKILTADELAEAGKPANTEDPAFTPVKTVNPEDGTPDNTWGSSWNASEGWQEVELMIAASGDKEKMTTFRLTGTTENGDKLFREGDKVMQIRNNSSAT